MEEAKCPDLRELYLHKQKAKQMSTKNVSNVAVTLILKVTICNEESGHAQHNFEPLDIGFSPAISHSIRWMLCLSSQKAVAQDCEKLKIFLRSACKLLSWREKLVDYWTEHEGRSYRWRLSDAHNLACVFTFLAVSKWHIFRIPASKCICMNVEVFQNKARRRKST